MTVLCNQALGNLKRVPDFFDWHLFIRHGRTKTRMKQWQRLQ
jgi:hypothetical protein